MTSEAEASEEEQQRRISAKRQFEDIYQCEIASRIKQQAGIEEIYSFSTGASIKLNSASSERTYRLMSVQKFTFNFDSHNFHREAEKYFHRKQNKFEKCAFRHEAPLVAGLKRRQLALAALLVGPIHENRHRCRTSCQTFSFCVNFASNQDIRSIFDGHD
ncbi:hypothetical protein T08_10649 [Trichinella sp. T8]|nr:hypothetical protein T08_10649 [Trichinella sp. T8]